MQWNSVADFLNMGGYAFYVWGSFGVTALVMLGEMWLIHRQRVQTLQLLRNEFSQESQTS